jgi:adenylylsulfate kinase
MILKKDKKVSLKHATDIKLNEQQAKVIWMTGLSGSGKTTLALEFNKLLLEKGFFTRIFDGDELRKGLCSDLGYTNEDRKENIRRAAELAKIFLDSRIIVICCFISPTNEIRELAKKIIGNDNYIEVFVDCPLDVCEKRDVKGFYSKARSGDIKNFTGVDSLYEAPKNPDIIINTAILSLKDSAKKLLDNTFPLLTKKAVK